MQEFRVVSGILAYVGLFWVPAVAPDGLISTTTPKPILGVRFL